MAVTLTEAAARHIDRYIARRGKGIGLRLGVKTSGCSGLSYKLEYADSQQESDRARGTERGLQVQQPQRAQRMRLRRVVQHLIPLDTPRTDRHDGTICL